MFSDLLCFEYLLYIFHKNILCLSLFSNSDVKSIFIWLYNFLVIKFNIILIPFFLYSGFPFSFLNSSCFPTYEKIETFELLKLACKGYKMTEDLLTSEKEAGLIYIFPHLKNVRRKKCVTKIDKEIKKRYVNLARSDETHG